MRSEIRVGMLGRVEMPVNEVAGIGIRRRENPDTRGLANEGARAAETCIYGWTEEDCANHVKQWQPGRR